MERASGVKKEKEPASSVQDASDRITRRGETIDDKIKKLDAELSRYKEQIKRMRPGQAQEAKKARAMRILKQKQTYEGQRDMLCNESFKLDQVAFAMEGIKDKDAQQTIQETFGGSYNVPDDLNEEELIVELNALEADMGMQTETGGPAYLQLDEGRIWILQCHHPAGHAAEPAGRSNAQAEDELVYLPSLVQKILPTFLIKC